MRSRKKLSRKMSRKMRNSFEEEIGARTTHPSLGIIAACLVYETLKTYVMIIECEQHNNYLLVCNSSFQMHTLKVESPYLTSYAAERCLGGVTPIPEISPHSFVHQKRPTMMDFWTR